MSVSGITYCSVTQPASAERLRRAYLSAREALLGERTAGACWIGELSPSALATATAVSALSVVSAERFGHLIAAGLHWLESDQNADGGWGDTPESRSNLPTTMLVRAAIDLAASGGYRVASACRERGESHIRRTAGPSPADQLRALEELYGSDRTFAVPILATCALAAESNAASRSAQAIWRRVYPLPFELACLPHACFRLMRLHVVSYALPALIATGQLIHKRCPTNNAFRRAVRDIAVAPTLRRLQAIQPESGGFLEAIPLTSFVLMALAATGRARHPVAGRAAAFIERSARADGSWPIDSNLSNWVTTLAVCALTSGGNDAGLDTEATTRWLLDCQHNSLHPYTASEPGGWGWTHLPGGVPDVDDTAGALVALARLHSRSAGRGRRGADGGPQRPAVNRAAAKGVMWLLARQNADGGWPTFCRGWGKLPFDRSAADLTAHALRAIASWPETARSECRRRAIARGFRYLRRVQRPDGSWAPLWFGNQRAHDEQNPVYGTARVLAAYRDLNADACAEVRRGVKFLISAQNTDGSWGGDHGVPGSMAETALAVGALAGRPDDPQAEIACMRGADYLAEGVAAGGLFAPVPIGLYFARLWYSEKLYPIIWTVEALGRVLEPHARPAHATARTYDTSR